MHILRRIVLAVSVGLLAASPAVAQEAQGRAWMTVDNVVIEDINTGVEGGFRWYNPDRHLRGLTGVELTHASDTTGATTVQQVAYTQLPDLPVIGLQSLADGTGQASARIDGVAVESGCGLLTINRLCLSSAGVATTATGLQDPGFWNMILAPHTRVIMDARSFVEVLLHDVCTTTCSFVFAQAQLRAEFGPFTDGLPDSLVRRTSANTVFLDSAALGGTGGVFTDSSEMNLHLVFENNTDQEVMGRIRWLVQVQAVTAVPEPGTYALMALGLVALVAARRRRV